jgi:Zn-dependent oligopeptidase
MDREADDSTPWLEAFPQESMIDQESVSHFTVYVVCNFAAVMAASP